MKCPYKKSCKNYSETSVTCNKLGGEYYEDGYCGTYRKLSKPKLKTIFILALFSLIIILSLGGVLGLTINAYDTNAVNWITSNANITINTYNQTWLDFDGVDDKINLTTLNFDTTGDLTIDFMIKPLSYGGGKLGRIFDSGTGFNVYVDNNSVSTYYERITLVSGGSNTAFSADYSIHLNEWNQVTIVRPASGSDIKIYINGLDRTSSDSTTDTPVASTSAYIGARSADDRNFNGSISHVIIFNKTLTSAEVLALHTNNYKFNVSYINLSISQIMASEGTASRLPRQSNSFYANGRYWLFYGSNVTGVYQSVSYISSLDGLTWGNATYVFSYPDCDADWTIEYNNGNVSYLTNTNMTGHNGLAYNRGIPLANGTIVWSPTTSQIFDNNTYYDDFTLREDTNGYPWVGGPRILNSSTNNGNFTINLNLSAYAYNNAERLLDGKMLFIYAYYGGDKKVSAKLFNSSGTFDETSVSSSYVYGQSGGGGASVSRLGSNTYGDKTYVAFQSNETKIIFIERNELGVWSSEKILDTQYVDLQSSPSITVDQSNGNLYLLWTYNATEIIFKSRINGVWSDSAILYKESFDDTYEHVQSYRNVGNNKIGLTYLNSGLSLKYLLFAINETSLLTDDKLVLKMMFNENGGSLVYDVSPFFVNKTVTGAVWSNDGNIITTTLNIVTTLLYPNNIITSPVAWLYNYLISTTQNGDDNYILLNNTNSTNSYTLNVSDITNLLATNGTSLCNGSTGLMTGQVNITLNPNEFCYVLDDYNLTEGVTREFSPIWISSSTNTNKHIASNLSDTIMIDITFNVDSCDNVGAIYYTAKGEDRIKYTKSDYTCSNNQVTLSSVRLNPSSDSNEVEIEYGCNTFTRTGYLLVILLSSAMLIMWLGFNIYNDYQSGDINVGKLIMLFISIVVSISLWLASGQNLSSCGVIG